MKIIITFLFSICTLALFGQNIAINEVCADNTTLLKDEDNTYQDYIEIYNYDTQAINLQGFGLSDDPSIPFKWIIPNITIPPNSYILIWASDKNRNNPAQPLHTNFKIGSTGEDIILTHSNGTLLNQAPATALATNQSLGRLPNGLGAFVIFQYPTPNKINVPEPSPVAPPIFSHTSGFYTSNISLSITHTNPAAVIIYTTDGSEPSINNTNGTNYKHKNSHHGGAFITKSFKSLTYSNNLTLQNKTSEANKLATISTTLNNDFFPSILIKKTNVIKAKAYLNGIESPTVTQTYFVSSTNTFNHTLPVVSITANEDDLFDYYKGIHVAGIDNLNSAGVSKCGYFNWNRETEVIGNFQYFINNQSVINQKIGIAIHGNCLRFSQNKSLRIYARSEYGNNSFDYPFFPNYAFDSFKRLILRSSGNDVVSTMFRDAFNQKLVGHLNFETQKYQPTVTYLNGEYWGILNLRERYDEFYLKRKYNLEETEIDFLENNTIINLGDNLHWINLNNYLNNNNLQNTANYEYVKTQLDEKSVIDYQIANIYIGNTDWPFNNVRYFRKKVPYIPNAPFAQDGRWRWMMFDTDGGFGFNSAPSFNTLSFATQNNGWPPDWSTLILRSLLSNNNFKEEFVNRYADLLNTSFLPQRAVGFINEMKQVIASEIPTHQTRWTTPTNWESNVNVMIDFANQRPSFARQHIISNFNLTGSFQLTVNVANAITSPASAYSNPFGYVKLNTIELTDATPGVPTNTFPWVGEYFNNVPITIQAIPKPGYVFSHWSGASNSTNTSITLTLNSNSGIVAHFVPENNPIQENLIYYWNFNNLITPSTGVPSITADYALISQANPTMTYARLYG